ncbi:hypothetical protein FPV16_17930 [Methylobacterium sp. W2]|uniref:hypothetical protein n=1 Tax=Methylobacterium sp. W2 TaxID=2598107 RepID=UPI001D0C53BA|nr:hypothetical protein [Methylobacterium sp. W2]MCC0808067.1 hypothetical protein [Methylobacterium sp. W2]
MDLDETLRNLAADTLAHRMVLEILAAQLLASIPAEQRAAFAQSVVSAAGRIDGLTAKPRSEERSEFLADVAVRTQQKVDGLISDAMARVGSIP